jgi:hypothetical protein
MDHLCRVAKLTLFAALILHMAVYRPIRRGAPARIVAQSETDGGREV